MKAADVMTLGAVTVNAEAPISEAAKLMIQYRVSGLPVINEHGALVGIITERDFLRRAEIGTEERRPRWSQILFAPGAAADDYVRSHARKVVDVMTEEVVTVNKDTPLTEVVALMEKHHIKRLPVVRDGKIIGILSRANFLRLVAGQLVEGVTVSDDDQTVRNRIFEELRDQPWTPSAGIDVTVCDGTAELRGVVGDDRIRRGIRVAVETVPGVKAVKDEMEIITPPPSAIF